MSRYRQSMREALEQVAQVEVFDEAIKWEVQISGLPTFYADGKSRGEVKQALRKMLKRPDDIQSIERTTPSELKKIRRGQIAGDEPGETKEEVEDEFDYKAKKGAIAAPGSGSIAKAKKPKATDVNKSIEQQMKDALKEHIKDTIKEKSTIDADQVVNMIQFGHPFKVVDEDIPPQLPGPEVPRYKNVSNAVVDKADKKSNKAMAKAEKDTLVPTQTKEQHRPEGGVTDDSGYTRYPRTGNWAGIKTGQKKTKSRAEIRKAIDPKGTAGKDLDKRIAKSVPAGKTTTGEVDQAGERARRRSLWKALKRPEEVEIDEGKMEEFHALIKQGKSADEIAKTLELDVKSVKDLMPEATASELELANAKKADKKQQGGSLRHKIWPASASMRMPKLEDAVAEVIGLKIDEWGDTGILPTQRARIAGRPDTPQDKERDALIKAVAKSPKQQALAKKQAKEEVSITQKGLDALRTARDKPQVKTQVKITKQGLAALKKDKENQNKDPVGKQHEVAPPGWGHTKAEYEKTKPDKPKSKIGGTAHEFDKDLKSGKFKGLPGDKTMKDKKASMFKIMWSQKNKGDTPHYKPGVKDKLKSQYKEEVEESNLPAHLRKFLDKDGNPNPEAAKRIEAGRRKRAVAAKTKDVTPPGYGPSKEQAGYISVASAEPRGLPGINPKKKSIRKEENLLDSAKRYLIQEKADWNTAFKSAAQSRPAMKYKDAVSFIDTAGLNSIEKRSALKAAKRWLR